MQYKMLIYTAVKLMKTHMHIPLPHAVALKFQSKCHAIMKRHYT